MSLRRRVHDLLASERTPSPAARVLRLALAVLIVGNVVAVVIETLPGVQAAAPTGFAVFELVSVVVFAIEYVLRLWAAAEDPRYAGALGRLRWACTPMALVDLAAILPTLLLGSALDLRSLRMLRLVRILRVVRLGRYSMALQTLMNVLRSKAPDLLSLFFVLAILLVVTSTLMFHCEHEAQPEAFSSIPATMWWAIVTLTTVGYGDMAPVTNVGRVLGGAIAILGIGMFALPAGLLGAAFVDELGKAREARRPHAPAGIGGHGPSCPHCGRALH